MAMIQTIFSKPATPAPSAAGVGHTIREHYSDRGIGNTPGSGDAAGSSTKQNLIPATGEAKSSQIPSTKGSFGGEAPAVSRQDENYLQFYIPFSLQGVPYAENTVLRPKLTDQIRTYILEGRAQRKLLVLIAPGGFGKTQLAVNFAKNYQGEFSSIFFIQAETLETLNQSIARALDNIWMVWSKESDRPPIKPTKPNDIKDAFRKWLMKPFNRRWLLIFDSIDHRRPIAKSSAAMSTNQEKDPNYDIIDYIPDVNHGATIITTRNSSYRSLGGETIPVKKMTKQEASELLAKSEDPDVVYRQYKMVPSLQASSAKRSDFKAVTKPLEEVLAVEEQDKGDSAHADDESSTIDPITNLGSIERQNLLGWLDGNPLAIECAGKRLRNDSGLNYKTLMEEFQHLELPRAGSGDIANSPEIQRMYTICTSTLDRLMEDEKKKKKEDIKKLGKPLKDQDDENPIRGLVLIMSYLDSRDLYFELLEFGKVGNHVPGWFLEVVETKSAFLQATQILQEYSLLIEDRNKKGVYTMHNAISLSCRYYAQTRNPDKYFGLAQACVSYSYPSDYNPKSQEIRKRLSPHGEALVTQFKQTGFTPQGFLFNEIEENERAVILELDEKNGNGQIDQYYNYFHPLLGLTELYLDLEKEETAIEVLLSVQKRLGIKSPLEKRRSEIAEYFKSQRYQNLEPILRLDQSSKYDHLSVTVNLMLALALYRKMYKSKEKQPEEIQKGFSVAVYAHHGRVSLFGPESREALFSKRLIAGFEALTENFDRAIAMGEEVRQMSSKLFTVKSTYHIGVLGDLADTYLSSGSEVGIQKASQLRTESFLAKVKRLGVEHPDCVWLAALISVRSISELEKMRNDGILYRTNAIDGMQSTLHSIDGSSKLEAVEDISSKLGSVADSSSKLGSVADSSSKIKSVTDSSSNLETANGQEGNISEDIMAKGRLHDVKLRLYSSEQSAQIAWFYEQIFEEQDAKQRRIKELQLQIIEQSRQLAWVYDQKEDVRMTTGVRQLIVKFMEKMPIEEDIDKLNLASDLKRLAESLLKTERIEDEDQFQKTLRERQNNAQNLASASWSSRKCIEQQLAKADENCQKLKLDVANGRSVMVLRFRISQLYLDLSRPEKAREILESIRDACKLESLIEPSDFEVVLSSLAYTYSLLEEENKLDLCVGEILRLPLGDETELACALRRVSTFQSCERYDLGLLILEKFHAEAKGKLLGFLESRNQPKDHAIHYLDDLEVEFQYASCLAGHQFNRKNTEVVEILSAILRVSKNDVRPQLLDMSCKATILMGNVQGTTQVNNRNDYLIQSQDLSRQLVSATLGDSQSDQGPAYRQLHDCTVSLVEAYISQDKLIEAESEIKNALKLGISCLNAIGAQRIASAEFLLGQILTFKKEFVSARPYLLAAQAHFLRNPMSPFNFEQLENSTWWLVFCYIKTNELSGALGEIVFLIGVYKELNDGGLFFRYGLANAVLLLLSGDLTNGLGSFLNLLKLVARDLGPDHSNAQICLKTLKAGLKWKSDSTDYSVSMNLSNPFSFVFTDSEEQNILFTDGGEEIDFKGHKLGEPKWEVLLVAGEIDQIKSELQKTYPDIYKCLRYNPPPADAIWPRSWTYYPSREGLTQEVPVWIARAPVIIPVCPDYPVSLSLIPPPDPQTSPIDCSTPLKPEQIKAIFKTYEFATGFAMLLDGRLQIYVPDHFNLKDVLWQYPRRFGTLVVDFVLAKLIPTNHPGDVQVNSSLETTIQGGKSKAPGPRSRLGLAIKNNAGDFLFTMASHAINAAIARELEYWPWPYLSSWFPKYSKLGWWKPRIQIMSKNNYIVGKALYTFDQESFSKPPGNMYKHDLTLVKPEDTCNIQAAKAPLHLKWLGSNRWDELCGQEESKVKLLGEPDFAATHLGRISPPNKERIAQVVGFYHPRENLNGEVSELDGCLLIRVPSALNSDVQGRSGTAVYTDSLHPTRGNSIHNFVVGFISFCQFIDKPPEDDVEKGQAEADVLTKNASWWALYKLHPDLINNYTIFCADPPAIADAERNEESEHSEQRTRTPDSGYESANRAGESSGARDEGTQTA